MELSIDNNVEQSCLPLFTSGGKRSRSDVSSTCWELFVASLRIPQAHAEFESLCSDPTALREAAGLLSVPLAGAATIQKVSRRPHPRVDRRRVRR